MDKQPEISDVRGDECLRKNKAGKKCREQQKCYLSIRGQKSLSDTDYLFFVFFFSVDLRK